MSEDRRDRELLERIAEAVRSADKSRAVPENEAETLLKAAGRLDQILAEAEAQERAEREAARAEEMQALRAAAGRLDRLLVHEQRKPTQSKQRNQESRSAKQLPDSEQS